MTDTLPWILLLLPLASALAIKFALPRAGGIAAIFGTAATAVTFGISLWLLGNAPASAPAFDWIRLPVGDAQPIRIGLFLGPLATAMMVVVTSIGLLVHIFSMGYMKEDAGRARYFAGLSLFMFSMTGIVLSDNFLMMFIFWELVGLSSYILIGHWFHKESAADAAKKAFITNRVGDFGFLTGILLLFGAAGTLDFATLQAKAIDGTLGLSGGMLVAAVLCLFCGAVGKSAQFPLHVWLPDAMEGPTPVSALIHAATMVAAGVYMLVRMSFLLFLPDAAQAANVIAWVGGGTALLAALMATQQDDIKRVLAYSTLSQLGYMTVALGASAYSVAVFHLMTHAFFKALLFLAAGSVIIGMHHNQDIRWMGGVRKYMPITWITSLLGSLALIGTPLFSGFYSKDSIIEAVHASTLPAAGFAHFAVLAGVFVTAFYSFRLYFLVFHGKERYDQNPDAHHGHDDHGHGGAHTPHESPWVVTVPLVLLAIPSVVIGFLTIGPMLFGDFFKDAIVVDAARHPAMAELAEIFHGPVAMALHGLTTAPFWLALAGVVVAYYMYMLNPALPAAIQRVFQPVHTLLEQKYFMDWINENILARAARGLGIGLWKGGDQTVIDGVLVNGSWRLVGWIAGWVRRVQTGYVFHYALVMILGIFVLMTYFVWLNK
jgi:NADH-quinone oxidoreductase subunit L